MRKLSREKNHIGHRQTLRLTNVGGPQQKTEHANRQVTPPQAVAKMRRRETGLITSLTKPNPGRNMIYTAEAHRTEQMLEKEWHRRRVTDENADADDRSIRYQQPCHVVTGVAESGPDSCNIAHTNNGSRNQRHARCGMCVL